MQDEYDYIVVGAGSAGCVLAARLSEDRSARVLLVEAGGKATGLLPNMPAAIAQTIRRADLGWGFQSEPEPGLARRKLEVRRGKVLGGCSQINGMIYARGDRNDYDDWARSGCTGWSYEEVLPYFKRSETSWAGETALRGGSGEMGVTISDEPSLLFKEFAESVRLAGLPVVENYHDDRPHGLIATEMTVDRRGRRANTYRAFIEPVLSRPNLTVVSQALVCKVLIERGVARGVVFRVAGRERTARAEAEVVLCAGSYGSAQLLMLSGVGDAQELAALGIRASVDLPGVGRNLVEHPMLYMGFQAKPRTFASELRFDRAARSFLRWAVWGTGPFATNVCAGNIYLRTDPTWNRADVQLGCPALSMGANVWMPWQQTQHGLSLGVIMLKQDSRGWVRLRSADPAAAPRIQFNLMQERSDVERMIRGVRAGREIYARGPLGEIVERESMPGAACASDADLEQFIRKACGITHHPVGTCRIGSDVEAVVDPYLRVRGIKGLRVADASVLPNVPAGNTNAPAIMVAERAADFLRNQTPQATERRTAKVEEINELTSGDSHAHS